jgi:hypothetical protein
LICGLTIGNGVDDGAIAAIEENVLQGLPF